VTLRATAHGPLVSTGGEQISLRFPIERSVRVWEQKLAMGKAKNLGEFRRALAMARLVGSNTTYADADGHIAFWYANSVPRRDPSFDWSKPVDGADPKTEWNGFLTPDELPHVIDPQCGFVQNCNSDPWHTSATDNPVPATVPPYVVRDRDTARAANSRRILTSKTRFSWNDLNRLAFDRYVFTAAERVPGLLQAGASRPDLREPLELLRAWDYHTGIHSVAATLYFESELDLLGSGMGNRRMLGGSSEDLLQALSRTVARLTRDFGTWRVPWGVANRLRRTPDGPSLPVAGAPSVFGQIFAFGYPLRPGGVHYGTEGNTYVSLTEFGPEPRSVSICGMGQSADPSSPHYFDQAPFYAAGRFRP
jgi:acyl-homoserine lactone acylase PvdQ